MARNNQLVEMSTFVAGLVTEASPLTFPANASIDEANFELLRNGSRRRRLGMDLEEDYVNVNLTTVDSGVEPAINVFKWRNVAGVADKEILVVQFSGQIAFFDMSSLVLSDGHIDTFEVTPNTVTSNYSFASIDGKLVVATGLEYPYYFTYNTDTGTISYNIITIYTRDMFGVYENDALDYNVGNRPTTLSDVHLYNLRNQGWGIPRRTRYSTVAGTEEREYDLVKFFYDANGVYPANSDSVSNALYPDVEDLEDKLIDRFDQGQLFANPVGSTPAAKGHFIIKAFNRGQSRTSLYASMMNRYPYLELDLTSSLPLDVAVNADGNVGGPSVVCEFAGRIFYGGNPSRVSGGDNFSPALYNYVFFTKLISNKRDFGICYQLGDPTSTEEFDLLDTDGGFIRISECYNICAMVEMGNKLVIFAENGVWYITGGNDFGFKATDYKVVKVSERGTKNPKSVVVINDAVSYWSSDGIYLISANQYGDIVANNISSQNINSFYTSLDEEDKLYASGIFDSYEGKIRWLYGNRVNGDGNVKELIFDIALQAFYKHTIGQLEAGVPLVVAQFITPPYRGFQSTEDITYLGETITYSGEDITYTSSVVFPSIREVKYLALTDITGMYTCSFSLYREETFYDWKSVDGVGVDAEAYMYAGYMYGAGVMLNKQVPYIYFYFNRTEDGFEVVDGQLVPTNQSSCKVQSQWNWSDSINSGNWSQEFQAYRYKRHFIPATAGSAYDYGFSVIETKNKLRGRGKVLSLYIHTDPGKDCQLLGWSMMVSTDGNA